MDTANSVSNTIMNTADTPILNTDSGQGTGIFEKLQNISFFTWVIIIFMLSFLGFNVFAYLAAGTQEATGIFAPIVKSISNMIRAITGQTIDIASEGGKGVVNAAANITTTGLNAVQDVGQAIQPNNGTTSLPNGEYGTSESPDNTSNNVLNKALNTAQIRKNQGQDQNDRDYQADEANSSIQGGGKSGWCYIGDDRGFRSCALVGLDDTCMSGDIFPTKEICVNPNLRQ
jgi:hypothetical protein